MTGSTSLFKVGTWGAGRRESEMGRETPTAQTDIVKHEYNIFGAKF